jgi:O-acetylhomoserine/O-acetylserine sulfhydrylase-like pyridoxal-dependent enzyme
MEHVRRAGCASLWTRGRFVMSRLERMRRRECHGVPRDAVATVAVHADARARAHAQRRAPDGYEHDLDIAPPIGVSATFEAADGGPVYSRANAPTRERAEVVLAAVEMAASAGRTPVRALLYASGAAATHAALHDMLSRRGCNYARAHT